LSTAHLDRRAAAATSTSLLKVPFASTVAGWPLTVIELIAFGFADAADQLALARPRTTAVLRPRVATKMGSRICSVPARREQRARAARALLERGDLRRWL
jgi:hypothetical protein